MSRDLDREMARAIDLARAGRLDQAITVLERLIKAAPKAVAIRYNLALFLLMRGRHADGIRHLDRILAEHPTHAEALFSKARGLMALERADEAVPILLRLGEGDDPDVLLALGNALRMVNRPVDATAAFRRLIARAPGHVGGHLNLGLLLVSSDPDAAVAALEQAVARHPGQAELQALLGQALLRLGRFEEAILRLDRALALDPTLAPARGHLLRACRESADWAREEQVFAAIRADIAQDKPAGKGLALATQEAIFHPFSGAEIRRIAEAEAAFRVPAAARRRLDPRPKAPPPLVVGYLSPDFRDHATMHLAGDLFAAHDRSRVRPIGLAVGPDDGSEWRARAVAGCDSFIDLSATSDAEAAARITDLGVNVLVDMSVYTRHARPGIAARRPAPLQMQWLGLAASSGAPWIDYAIVDAVLVPPAQRDHFSERLIFLPHGYQANLAWTPPPPAPPRPSLGLPEGEMVFCSFNGHRKLDRASFTLWMQVLAQVPGSVLWQLAPPEPARRRLEAAATAQGIDPARLIWAPRLARDAHLARLPAADLFLDALICGAHTTAADALRMGVPLLTCAGDRLAGRVAAALLSAVGLPELVCDSPAAFLALAVALGRDAGRRAELRARLATLMPVAVPFDPKRFAADLEQAYDRAWAGYAAGRKASDIIL